VKSSRNILRGWCKTTSSTTARKIPTQNGSQKRAGPAGKNEQVAREYPASPSVVLSKTLVYDPRWPEENNGPKMFAGVSCQRVFYGVALKIRK
jgi:hypothetical protein